MADETKQTERHRLSKTGVVVSNKMTKTVTVSLPPRSAACLAWRLRRAIRSVRSASSFCVT